MVNPNDPAAIPYVISEDDGAFWYVAYKEKSPGIPYITVSAKGVANGLSTEYNDGYDFGPDSYNPNISSGIPVTQTSGIQEALNYYISQQTSGNDIDVPRIMSGNYIINAPMQPLVIPKTSSPMSIGLIGEDLLTTGITLNYSSSTAFFTIDSSSINNLNFMNFRFHEIVVSNTTNGIAPFFNVDFSGATTPNTNVLEISDFVFGNQVGLTAINAVGFQSIDIKALQNYGSFLNLNASLINVFGYGNASSGNYMEVSGGTAYLYSSNGANIAGNIDLVVIDGIGSASWVTFGQVNAATPITIGTLIIKNMLGSGGFNQALLVNNLAYTVTINRLIIKDITAYNLTSNAGFIANPFSGGNVVINYADIDGIYSNNSYHWVDIPFNSTTNGTTAGTVVMQSKTYKPDYKKYIITFSGYENDTTTAQTIDFPLAFATSALISGNNTGLTISTTQTGITITAPDSTTTYSGIVIVEGY